MGFQVAVVTGASSGIGLETVKSLLKGDTELIFVVSRSEERLRAAFGEEDKRIVIVAADLSTVDGCEAACSQILAKSEKIDLLVNNAGAGTMGARLESISVEDFDWHYNLNVRSVFLMTKLLLLALRNAKGAVINVSSIAAMRALPGVGAYCTAKAGVDHLTKCMAIEFAPDVRVNAIRPATVATNFHSAGGMDDATVKDYYADAGAAAHPLGRVGRPEEIADAILFCASSKWMTGSALCVDGGRTLTMATAPGLSK